METPTEMYRVNNYRKQVNVITTLYVESSVKYCIGNSKGLTLNLYIILGNMDILIILIFQPINMEYLFTCLCIHSLFSFYQF